MIFLLFFISNLVFSSTSLEVGAYSNFIWRGTTFSENRPAVQAQMEYELKHGFYFGGFISNAEFSDPGLHKNSQVTSEADVIIGKRWSFDQGQIQFFYSQFYFPGAGVFDTDEWNLQITIESFLVELSLLDDYFGYHSRYEYVRLGYSWIYRPALEGFLSIGYSMFDRTRGNIRSLNGFESLDGAGNSNYIDIYFLNQKILDNKHTAEFSVNWTDRKEYSVEGGKISKKMAKDFTFIVAYVIPIEL